MSSVLYLVPDLLGPPGGIARHGRLTSRALLESGVDVHTIALMDASRPLLSDAEHLFGLLYTPCAGSRSSLVRRAIAGMMRTPPQLVLVGHVNLAPLGWALARLARAPMVTFIHGIDAWSPLPRTRRLALQHSTRVIAVSRYTATQATQSNTLDPDRLRVLHNCLDPRLSLTSPRLPDTDTLSLLTVARMSLAEQYKGHDVVLHAMPELLRRFPGLRYDIIGDGDARPGLQALAQQLGVASAVRFHGIVSEAALRSHYAQASLFTLPSRAEGFGLVFLEAMVHGLPIVAGNLDATPEVVVHGETGLLVDPTSSTQIADAIATLLADPLRRQTMGIAAQRRVEEHFSFSQFQQHLLAILAELGVFVSTPP